MLGESFNYFLGKLKILYNPSFFKISFIYMYLKSVVDFLNST